MDEQQGRLVVAYRHPLGKKVTGKDNEVVCLTCAAEGDRAIVLHSDNGARVRAGSIRCSVCQTRITVPAHTATHS